MRKRHPCKADFLEWRHNKTVDAYSSPLELHFSVVFTLSFGLAAISVVLAVFAG